MRSCVDKWIVNYVCTVVDMNGIAAHDVLFQARSELGGDSVFKVITERWAENLPEIKKLMFARVFAATRFCTNSNEVRAILEM
jgi:hypothetical protein